MQKCEIFNEQNISLNISILKFICERVIAEERKNFSRSSFKGPYNINLVFVSKKDMVYYNHYRNVEGPTDVLAFRYATSELLGEIYVCPECVKENSEYFKVPFGEEMVRVCIHGILHLFGYDHEEDKDKAKVMFEKQEAYVREFSDSLDNIS